MQVRATIEISGDPEEVGTALTSVGAILPQEAVSEPPAEDSAWWTPNRVDQLAGQITDNARHALRVICENAPEVPFDVVLDALGMDGIATGGVMASVGFALRNMDAPQFLARNYGRRVYIIDPEVAERVLAALRHREGR